MAITTSAIVQKIIEHEGDIREFIILPEKKASYEPGQFLQLSLDEVDASACWTKSRTFSIASYGKDTLRLIIKKVGKYTTRIFEELREESKISIKYAYGDFLLPFDDEEEVLCIAGGTGISPILSFIDFLEQEGNLERFKLFYSARTQKQLLDLEHLKELLKDNGQFYVTREQPEDESIKFGRIPLEDVIKKCTEDTNIYICGSVDFIRYYKENLEKMGYENIVLDEWE